MVASVGFYRNNQYAPITSSLDQLNPGYNTSHTMQGRSALQNGKIASKVAEEVNSNNPILRSNPNGVSSANERAQANAFGASMRAANNAAGAQPRGVAARGSDFDYGNAGIKTEEDALREAAEKSHKQVLDQEDFLRLLTAQLAAQDPTKPADNTELVSQMSQLSMVESLNSLNTYMSDMIQSVTSSSALNASSLIGKYVLTEDNKGFFSGGNILNWKVDAGTETYYDVQVKVKDATTGEVVFLDHANSLTGTINWGWLGISAPNGLDENGRPINPDGSVDWTPIEPGEGGGDGSGNEVTHHASREGDTGAGGEGDDSVDWTPIEDPSDGTGGDKPDGGQGNGDIKYDYVAAGKYVLEVTGINSKGQSVTIPTKAYAQVTAVTLAPTLEDTMLTLFGMGQMSYSKIKDVTTL